MKLLERSRQSGATVVEFALVVIVLILLMFGLIEFGRAIFQWNSAAEATRHGARVAAIVAPDAGGRSQILAAMHGAMPELQDGQLVVEYSTNGIAFGPAGTCSRDTVPPCTYVRVSVDVDFTFIAGIWGQGGSALSIAMPAFATTVPIEALGYT